MGSTLQGSGVKWLKILFQNNDKIAISENNLAKILVILIIPKDIKLVKYWVNFVFIILTYFNELYDLLTNWSF